MKHQHGLFKTIFSRKSLIILFLGFSSGLPFLLISGTLKTWLTRENVDISTIGYFSWVGLSYSLKFLWAPLLDRFSLLPLGRRRSWMLVTQILLGVLIVLLGTLDPKLNLFEMAALCIVIGFLSATQDIAIDAFRREFLLDDELGLGTSLAIYGHRLAMLLTGGIGVGLVTESGTWGLSWHQLYFLMGSLLIVGVITTLMVEEPVNKAIQPHSLKETIVDPFLEFMKRPGSVVILAFIFFFKFGDAIAGAMMTPLYVHVGFSNQEIGLIAKTFGLMSSLGGLFLGGVVIYYVGIYRSLVVFGVLQALSTVAFALLCYTGPNPLALGGVVVFEDVSSGMGSSAFVAFMAQLTNKKYTATQFALLSSLATVGRNFFSGFSGDMIKVLDWPGFFITCGLLAVPGLTLLAFMKKYQQQS